MSVAKFTSAERSLAKSILATLSIKKIPDAEIIKEIERQTNTQEKIARGFGLRLLVVDDNE